MLYAFGHGNKLEDAQVLRAEDQKDKYLVEEVTLIGKLGPILDRERGLNLTYILCIHVQYFGIGE